MRASWKKLLSREGVDITTISGIDLFFFRAAWDFTASRRELFFTYFYKDNFTHYIGFDPSELGRSLQRKHFNSKKQIHKYYNEGLVFLQAIKKHSKSWHQRLDKNNSYLILLQAFRECRRDFIKACDIYSITSWLALDAWQYDIEAILSGLISKRGLEEHREQITASIYKPWKPTALIELRKKAAAGASMSSLVKEYQFLRSWSLIWHRPLKTAWVKNMVKDEKSRSGKILPLNKVRQLLKPTSGEWRQLVLAPELIFFKDWRDDVRRQQVYYWSFLFAKLAKFFKCSIHDIGYMSLDEIEKAIKDKKFDTSLIARRKSRVCIITYSKKSSNIKIIDQKVPDFYKQRMKQAEQGHRLTKLKGLVAFRGRTVGRVIIIHSYHDLKRVKKGDVLVANTTHPNYLPGMRKASAFITNEGGIISHAAIVAREMKKPCIVGTKTATRVLKDGDKVEVNANSGIVKKLQ